MNAATARTTIEARTPATAPLVARKPCIVTDLPGVDLARAAWLACRDMALTEEEFEATLGGLAVTEWLPPFPGECHRAYAGRAASTVMVAYILG